MAHVNMRQTAVSISEIKTIIFTDFFLHWHWHWHWLTSFLLVSCISCEEKKTKEIAGCKFIREMRFESQIQFVSKTKNSLAFNFFLFDHRFCMILVNFATPCNSLHVFCWCFFCAFVKWLHSMKIREQ